MYKTFYLQDDCTFVFYFSAFDKHINLTLSATSTEEFGGKKFSNEFEEDRRTLEMVLLREEHLESMIVDGLSWYFF